MLRTAGAVFVWIGIVATAAAQDPVKVVKISDSIYMAPMASNVYLVMTPEGNVVIDTAPAAQASEAKELLTAVSHAPVKYIILTHGHADHIGGINLWKQPGTQIIAQRNYVELLNYVTRLDGFFAPRNAVAFNHPVPAVGAWAGDYGAVIDPTILFDQSYEFTLGGVKFELFSIPGKSRSLAITTPGSAFLNRCPSRISMPSAGPRRVPHSTGPNQSILWLRSNLK